MLSHKNTPDTVVSELLKKLQKDEINKQLISTNFEEFYKRLKDSTYSKDLYDYIATNTDVLWHINDIVDYNSLPKSITSREEVKNILACSDNLTFEFAKEIIDDCFVDDINNKKNKPLENLLQNVNLFNDESLGNRVMEYFLNEAENKEIYIKSIMGHLHYYIDDGLLEKIDSNTLVRMSKHSPYRMLKTILLSNNFPSDKIEDVLLENLSEDELNDFVNDISIINNKKLLNVLKNSKILKLQNLYKDYNISIMESEDYSSLLMNTVNNSIRASIANTGTEALMELAKFGLEKANVPKLILDNPKFNIALKALLPVLLIWISHDYDETLRSNDILSNKNINRLKEYSKLMLTEVSVETLKPIMNEVILPTINKMITSGELKELTSKSETTKMLKD